MRKPVTKLALATFDLATFVYSLTLLARVGTTTAAHTVPRGAVGLAFLLVMASVLVFVVFVHSTVPLQRRVSYRGLRRSSTSRSRTILTMFVPASAYHEVPEPPATSRRPATVPFEPSGPR